MEVFIAYLLLTGLGCVCLYQGLGKLLITFRLKKNGMRAEGIISELHYRRLAWTPVIKFSDADGREIEAVPQNAVYVDGPGHDSIGKKKKICYDPGDSYLFVTVSLWPKIFWIFITLVGLFLMVPLVKLIYDTVK
jgi:hypothetical protein